MIEQRVHLRRAHGLHVRVAAEVVRALHGMDARVSIRYGDKEADARSALKLMGLGATHGAGLVVQADGAQAEEAAAAVAAVLAQEG